MTLTPTLPPDVQWYTWSERPAEAVFQPLGIRIAPLLYSTRARAVSQIAPRRDPVRLGPHGLGTCRAELETELAGTRLALSLDPAGPFVQRGGWQRRKAGEWGARFWLTLAVSAEAADELRYDAAAQAVMIRCGSRWAAIVTAAPPILVSGHDSVAALAADLEANGYFSLATRAEAAPVLGLRFNLDMMPEGRWCAAVADAPGLALEQARAGLDPAPLPLPLRPRQAGAGEGGLDAIRDILGWNTVWDAANRRRYTTVSRVWNLGDYAVFANDQAYAALLAAVLDPELARENLAIALGIATPQGNLAALVSSHDAWTDRSQPPLGGLIAWMIYQRSGDRAGLAAQFGTLLRHQRWWRAMRDPQGTGLVSCGSSDVGTALYKGTHFAARNETGMDNSATHDEAQIDPATGCLATWDLGLNCAVALDAEMLGLIAAELGETAIAGEMAALAEAHRAAIRERLWDPERKIFANRHLAGGFVRALAPTAFYPLLCGAADAGQTAHLLAHLADPQLFGTPFPLPNAARSEAAYGENVYWRGRVWPNVNFLVWMGLCRAGQDEAAARLAAQSRDLFMRNWQDRVAGENFNAETGEALDQGDADPFYTWAALLPMIGVEEICGISPWEGWTLSNGAEAELGPLETPIGPAVVRREAGWLSLEGPQGAVLRTDHPGRLRQLRIGAGHLGCQVSPSQTGARLELPGVAAARLVQIRCGGAVLEPAPGGMAAVKLPPSADWQRLDIWMLPEAG
ncbi:trehalase family glycosidase [Poseidonocella sp. HB161398]|uniref:MGH1-like glycoside hydrolase domain-containing protein n=1 Tax=Poseidonocella sp. HB161398 TaxID=2320855 RepID=UPI001108B662|nr:trehalase family glycosidase [Poseidonocella sp. HB161398]